MTEFICTFCKVSVSTKYVLKNHMDTNKACLALRNLEFKTKFICKGCNNYSIDIQKLNNHQKICKEYQIYMLKERYEKKIKEIEKEFGETIIQHETKIKEQVLSFEKIIKDLQTQNDKLFSTIENLASKAIERPSTTTTTTTNNVTNNIRATFSDTYFLEDIKEEDVKRKFQNYLTEETFFGGQRTIAKLCSDHIIRTKDKKVLLTCTDTSRKKFKYVDEKGNVKEDHEARLFTEKISKPIKAVSKEVYDSILFDVKNEKETLEDDDYSRKAFLNNKELSAIDSYVKITYFDDPEHNNDFKNELAILNK